MCEWIDVMASVQRKKKSISGIAVFRRAEKTVLDIKSLSQRNWPNIRAYKCYHCIEDDILHSMVLF